MDRVHTTLQSIQTPNLVIKHDHICIVKTRPSKKVGACVFSLLEIAQIVSISNKTKGNTRQARWKVFFGSLKTFHSIHSQDPRCLGLGEDAYQSNDISESIHPAMKDPICDATRKIAYWIEDMSTRVSGLIQSILGWIHRFRRLLRQTPKIFLYRYCSFDFRNATTLFSSSMHCFSSAIVRVQYINFPIKIKHYNCGEPKSG